MRVSLNGVQVGGRGRSGLNQLRGFFCVLGDAGDKFLEELVLLGSELLDDVGKEVLNSLGLGFSAHDEGVVLDGGIGLGVLEVEDGVVIAEEVNLINTEGMSSDLLDDALDDLVAAGLSEKEITVVLLMTLTFLRWEPFPPVRASPTLFLSFSMLAWISSWLSSIRYHNIKY